MTLSKDLVIPAGIAFFLLGALIVFLALNDNGGEDVRWRCDQRNLVYLDESGDVTAVSPQDPRCS